VRVLTIGIEYSLDVPIQRPHDADARKHRRAVIVDDQEHRFDRGLPFLEVLFGLGVLERDELAARAEAGSGGIEAAGSQLAQGMPA
jgi:hypothetical protein